MQKTPSISTRPFTIQPALGNLHPVIANVYAARGITDMAQVDYRMKHMHPPQTLRGIEKAVRLITEALEQQQRILIVGDFDADGATSTTLMLRMLTQMGAQNLDYLVPNRLEFGYGLSTELIDSATELRPELIITVDNGISSFDGVEHAHARGIKVVVTDHHLPPAVLPNADAIVNPNVCGDEFPSKCLAGVGVAFYVMVALRAHLRSINWFTQRNIQEPDLRHVLDLVALGTIADVVPLDFNNRLLVTQGLQRIKSGQGCPGIEALLSLAKRSVDTVQASDLGFAVAPRLNAAGRLDDISIGIECLVTDDANIAMEYAHALDGINLERRHIENQMKSEAFTILQSLQSSLQMQQNKLPAALCLHHDNWHAGVVGIVASRIKDKYHRPVVAFALEQQGVLKGSARSVHGLHIKDVMEHINTEHPDLIVKFGGHAMAAGLTLHASKLEAFKQIFAHEVEKKLGADVGHKVLETDGILAVHDMTLLVADHIECAGPWGQQFPEPTFFGTFELVTKRVLKDTHLKMIVRYQGTEFDAIAFNYTGADLADTPNTNVILVYKLSINVFRGKRSLQLIVDYAAPESPHN